MAITAVADVLALVTATDTDIQPAAGEIWLIKTLLHAAGDGGGNSAVWRTGLYDGTDFAYLLYRVIHNSGHDTRAGLESAPAPSGTIFYAEQQRVAMSVILTNTVRMRTRFGDSTGSGALLGYSGVKL